jgi:hypothetical protein
MRRRSAGPEEDDGGQGFVGYMSGCERCFGRDGEGYDGWTAENFTGGVELGGGGEK